jgi:hypothetical protein
MASAADISGDETRLHHDMADFEKISSLPPLTPVLSRARRLPQHEPRKGHPEPRQDRKQQDKERDLDSGNPFHIDEYA